VEAPAQGDEGGRPEEVENPGEHRAPDGLNTRLGATNFRGEKGPEDEPISQCTACLRSIRARTSVRRTGERREPGLKTRRQLRLVARVKDERWMWNLVSAPSSTSPTQTVPSRGRPWHKSRADAPRGGPASAGTPKEAADAGFSLRPMRGLVPGSGFGRPREFYEAGAGRRNRPRRAGRRHPSGYHRPARRRPGSRTGGSRSSWPVALRHHRPGQRSLRRPEPTRAARESSPPGPPEARHARVSFGSPERDGSPVGSSDWHPDPRSWQPPHLGVAGPGPGRDVAPGSRRQEAGMRRTGSPVCGASSLTARVHGRNGA
jgi:hypothetical protein